MGRLSIAQKKAQIQRIIDANVDPSWSEEEVRTYKSQTEAVKSLALTMGLPTSIEYNILRKIIVMLIKEKRKEVVFDPQTLKEMEEMGDDSILKMLFG